MQFLGVPITWDWKWHNPFEATGNLLAGLGNMGGAALGAPPLFPGTVIQGNNAYPFNSTQTNSSGTPSMILWIITGVAAVTAVMLLKGKIK